jgi:hypothetical protein
MSHARGGAAMVPDGDDGDAEAGPRGSGTTAPNGSVAPERATEGEVVGVAVHVDDNGVWHEVSRPAQEGTAPARDEKEEDAAAATAEWVDGHDSRPPMRRMTRPRWPSMRSISTTHRSPPAGHDGEATGNRGMGACDDDDDAERRASRTGTTDGWPRMAAMAANSRNTMCTLAGDTPGRNADVTGPSRAAR